MPAFWIYFAQYPARIAQRGDLTASLSTVSHCGDVSSTHADIRLPPSSHPRPCAGPRFFGNVTSRISRVSNRYARAETYYNSLLAISDRSRLCTRPRSIRDAMLWSIETILQVFQSFQFSNTSKHDRDTIKRLTRWCYESYVTEWTWFFPFLSTWLII